MNRALCDVNGQDLFKKFAPLDSAWSDLHIPVLCTKLPRNTEDCLQLQFASSVFSDSCLGCGEKRYLPEGVQTEMKDFLTHSTNQMDPDRAFHLIGEELDTPAFSVDDIDYTCEHLGALDSKVISIILAHHNLLPQTIPRISIYTDVINAGLIRSRLLRCNRPVLYCHGHVHDNPIEIIRIPRNSAYPLICISAPMLTKGFNLLTIEYGRNGTPVGCIVTYYGIHNDGSVNRSTETRIPLHTLSTAEKLLHQDTPGILSLIQTEFMRFGDIHKAVCSDFREIQSRTLCDSLIEAEWVGLVEICNREDEHTYWQIRRIRI